MNNGSKLKSRIKCVAHVAREYASLAGAGGIKDVTEGLCKATAQSGITTYLFMPFYRVIKDRCKINWEREYEFDVPMNYPNQPRFEKVTVFSSMLEANLKVFVIESDRYSFLAEDPSVERKGIYQYTKDEAAALGRPELNGKGYYDYFAMNVLLIKATLLTIERLEVKPDVVHCHDGHAALLPVIAQTSYEGYAPFLHYLPTVVTVHNAGKGYHQEVGDLNFAAAICGIPQEIVNGCLLDGMFDPLLAGAIFTGVINTVSENYARELQFSGQDWMTGWLGHKFSGLGIELRGVTNGIDPEAFNPEQPEKLGIPEGFSPLNQEFAGKENCKEAILNKIAQGAIPKNLVLHGNIEYRKGAPLLTFIGRLDYQKGYDILAQALEQLLQADNQVQVLGLGSGDPGIEANFKSLAAQHQGRVAVAIGYSPSLANEIYAAGDFFLIPSRFEPCGLTDFFAQLVGNIPIVQNIGGLVKTMDGLYGFSYLGGSEALLTTINRALKVYRAPNQTELRTIQVDAVKNIHEYFTWEKVLEKKYLPIYEDAANHTLPALPY